MEYITYEMFGALGDGVSDDMPAIVKAHAEANLRNLPVRAKAGAAYYISPKAMTAVVNTSADWTGAKFIIDDINCEKFQSPIFSVTSTLKPVELPLKRLEYAQTRVDNPHNRELYVMVSNNNHMDYIRRGLNRTNGAPRRDNFILRADGSMPSPVSFEFTEITDIACMPVDTQKLTLTGGEFTTIANRAESKYGSLSRNITITRSNVEARGITHLVTCEIEHGAPYAGFISISNCARVTVRDCVFTAHRIYETIGSAGLPVQMGSYDILLTSASDVMLSNCSQTTDILDERYWGIMGSNYCRDLALEDCRFSRFDAHMGVTNCALKRCALGWQCLNAIGFGTFLIEDTRAYGSAFVNLRGDYGSTWRGDIIIKNCVWHPRGNKRSIFSASNDGAHYFGYECYLPERVIIDGLQIIEDGADASAPMYVFNDYSGGGVNTRREYAPRAPLSVKISNISAARDIKLCAAPELMPDTEFIYSR